MRGTRFLPTDLFATDFQRIYTMCNGFIYNGFTQCATDLFKVETKSLMATHTPLTRQKMNCPICFEDSDEMYTIKCGSKTPHQICHPCEINMRCLANPTNLGRFIKCPMCRTVESTQGKRSIQSYQTELARLYAPLPHAPQPPAPLPPRVPVPPAPLPAPVRPPPAPGPQWCQSGRRDIGLCPTKGKTKRHCSVATCRYKVCRACKRCTNH